MLKTVLGTRDLYDSFRHQRSRCSLTVLSIMHTICKEAVGAAPLHWLNNLLTQKNFYGCLKSLHIFPMTYFRLKSNDKLGGLNHIKTNVAKNYANCFKCCNTNFNPLVLSRMLWFEGGCKAWIKENLFLSLKISQ